MEKYRIVEKLSSGSCGTVFKILKVTDMSTLVLKRIPLLELDSPQREQAKLEVELMKKLRHPYIVTYSDAFLFHDEDLCIIMEHLGGGDFATVINEAKDASREGRMFPESRVLCWLVQMLLALHYLHSHRILHRDLKTQNVFLNSETNEVAIGDFGVAKILESSSSATTATSGTPLYMAPEVLQGNVYSFQSDVWSVGCILYELLCFKHPFQAHDIGGLMVKVIRGDVAPIPGRYSTELQQLVHLMLERNPTKRPLVDDLLTMPILQKAMRAYFSPADEIPNSNPSNIQAAAIGGRTNNNNHMRGRPSAATKAHKGIAFPNAYSEDPGEAMLASQLGMIGVSIPPAFAPQQQQQFTATGVGTVVGESSFSPPRVSPSGVSSNQRGRHSGFDGTSTGGGGGGGMAFGGRSPYSLTGASMAELYAENERVPLSPSPTSGGNNDNHFSGTVTMGSYSQGPIHHFIHNNPPSAAGNNGQVVSLPPLIDEDRNRGYAQDFSRQMHHQHPPPNPSFNREHELYDDHLGGGGPPLHYNDHYNPVNAQTPPPYPSGSGHGNYDRQVFSSSSPGRDRLGVGVSSSSGTGVPAYRAHSRLVNVAHQHQAVESPQRSSHDREDALYVQTKDRDRQFVDTRQAHLAGIYGTPKRPVADVVNSLLVAGGGGGGHDQQQYYHSPPTNPGGVSSNPKAMQLEQKRRKLTQECQNKLGRKAFQRFVEYIQKHPKARTRKKTDMKEIGDVTNLLNMAAKVEEIIEIDQMLTEGRSQ